MNINSYFVYSLIRQVLRIPSFINFDNIVNSQRTYYNIAEYNWVNFICENIRLVSILGSNFRNSVEK